MTTPPSSSPAAGSGCPHHSSQPAFASPAELDPLPIYGEAFSADPHATYRQLRERGPITPVEIAPGVRGYLTTTYAAALHLLRNTPRIFRKDPGHWAALREGRVPANSPALGMMKKRANALWEDGRAHRRLRQAIVDALAPVNLHDLAATVVRVADQLIDVFAGRGSADLVAEFADVLPLLVIFELFGCSPELGFRIIAGTMALFDATRNPDEVNAELDAACGELIDQKLARPGRDITTRLLQHPAKLTREEMTEQLVLLLGAAGPPSTNAIINMLLLAAEDEEVGMSLYKGTESVAAVLDAVLWKDPPVSNFSPLYALEPYNYQGWEIEPEVPILVSFAAANTDPAVAQAAGNRAHLAFSAGVHGCPAEDMGRIIIETAVERLLDRCPDIALDMDREELTRRPGPFHSGWAAPVHFRFSAPPPATALHGAY